MGKPLTRYIQAGHVVQRHPLSSQLLCRHHDLYVSSILRVLTADASRIHNKTPHRATRAVHKRLSAATEVTKWKRGYQRHNSPRLSLTRPRVACAISTQAPVAGCRLLIGLSSGERNCVSLTSSLECGNVVARYSSKCVLVSSWLLGT